MADNEHALFSLTGEGTGEGTRVLPVGPSLRARVVALAGEAECDAGAPTAMQIKELRGRRCRAVVVACRKV